MADAVSQIVITARDDTAGVLSGIQRNVANLTSGFSTLNTLIGSALVASTVAWGESIVSAAADLQKLSTITGSSVENLSRLANVAKVSGTSFDTFQLLLSKMTVGMAGMDDTSSKAAKALSFLGVKARDPALALQEVANRLDTFSDGAGKAALAVALFGKQGAQFLEVLKDLAHAQGISATVTTKQAEEADKLEKEFRKISVQATLMKDALLTYVVPTLAEMVTAFNLARVAGLGFWASILGPEDVQGAQDKLDAWKKKLTDTQALIAKQEALGNLGAAAASRRDLAGIQAKVEAYTRLRNLYIQTAPFVGPEAPKPQATFTGGDAKAVADYASEIAKLNADLLKITGNDGGYTHWLAAVEKVDSDRRAGKVINEAEARSFKQLALDVDEQAKSMKALAEAWDSYEKSAKASLDFQKEIDDAILKANLGIKAQNEALQLEHDTLGLTDNERQVYITTKALEVAITDKNTNAIILLNKQLDLLAQRGQDHAFLDMMEAARQSIEQTTRFVSDFFTDLLTRGTDSFKTLWQSFKQLAFRAMSEIAAKQIVLSVTAAIGGGASGVASAGGIVPALLGGSGGLPGGLPGLLGAFGGSGVAGDAFLPGALGSNFGALMAGIPVAGWATLAAIAIPAIIKVFDKGDATRNATFASGFLGNDPSRDAAFSGSSAFGAFGFSRDKWLSPTDAGAGQAFATLSTTITTLDNAIAKLAPGKTGAISAALSGHTLDVGLGKEHTDISQFLPAILKDRYATVLGAIDADLGKLVENFQGTGEELAKFVTGIVALHEGLTEAPLADILSEVARSSASSFDALVNIAEGLRQLIDGFDGSADSLTNLVGATDQYRQAMYALIAQIEQVRQAIDEMFGDTIRNLTLQTLDPTAKYAFITNEINSLYDQALAETDPEKIKGLADKINSDINAAFGLLDPESQKAKLSEFIGNTGEINKGLNERLNAIETDVHDSVADVLVEVSAKLDAVAAKFQTAADTQLVAAETPLTINLTGNPASEVTGGG